MIFLFSRIYRFLRSGWYPVRSNHVRGHPTKRTIGFSAGWTSGGRIRSCRNFRAHAATFQRQSESWASFPPCFCGADGPRKKLAFIENEMTNCLTDSMISEYRLQKFTHFEMEERNTSEASEIECNIQRKYHTFNTAMFCAFSSTLKFPHSRWLFCTFVKCWRHSHKQTVPH